MTLIPSEYTPDPEVRALLAELEKTRAAGHSRFEVSRFVGYDRNGCPDYPEVRLRIETGGYGCPVGSVGIRRTGTTHAYDFAGSLDNLDPSVACAYYLSLNSVEALDAVEKVLRAPTPKALALIALLDQLTGPKRTDPAAGAIPIESKTQEITIT